MTHASGLQYSYDDLDLVCCHGVDSEGVWMGAGATKQGRRTRCASMPEGCHQLPTEELAQTVEVTASVTNDDTGSKEFKLMKSSVKVTLDLQEESVRGPHDLVDVDIPQGASESEHLQSTNIGYHGQSHWYSNSGMSVANISCATDSSGHSEKIINGEAEVGTESTQTHDRGNNDNVLKSPHITHEEKQSISISSNNGPPLSESAGEQSGKRPNNQETKESHTEGYSRPPEIFDATLNQSSPAGMEPQADLPDVEKEKIYTSSHADASVILPVGVLSSRVDIMENGDVMSQASKAVEPVVTLVVEEVYEKGVAGSWTADSADKLDGLNAPETLNENPELKLHLRDIQGGEQDPHDCAGILDQARGSEISYQTLLEQHNVEMTVMSQGEESAQAERSEKAPDVRYEPITSPDDCFKGQCCSLTVEKLDNGYSEGSHRETNITHCVNQYLEMTAYERQPWEKRDESSVSKELARYEDPAIAQQLENSFSKLDTIPEVGHIEPYDTPVPDPQKNLIFTQNPDDQQSHVDGEHAPTDQDTKNLPPCSAAVCNELSPEGLHSNQEASGRYFCESPGSEVADGQSEHHRPAAVVSRMEAIYSDTQLASPVLDGTNEPGDQKADNVVKVRMRKVRLYLI